MAAQQPHAPSLLASYLDALVAGDIRAARATISGAAADGADLRALYLEVLQPALYEIGRLWERARISVAQEHLATATTEAVMAELAPLLRRPGEAPSRGRVVLACSDGELHRVGSRMVADFLEADGWEVLFLGALTPPDQLIALVAEQHPEVVAVSASLPDRLGEVEVACRALAELRPRPFVVAGGLAFGGDEALARSVGADAYGRDAAHTAALLAGGGFATR